MGIQPHDDEVDTVIEVPNDPRTCFESLSRGALVLNYILLEKHISRIPGPTTTS